MRNLAAFVLLLAGAVLPADLVAASNIDAPDGVVPTSMTLTQLMALHKRAVGELSNAAHTSSAAWLITRGDLSGSATTTTSGDDNREDTILGPFHTASGSYHGQTWEQNANGLTMLGSGLHRRADIAAHALAHPLTAGSGVTLLGQVRSTAPAYVVKVAPPGGRVEYLFFDEASHLIIRTERAFEDQRVVSTYDDFRTTSGRTSAWHVHESDGRPFNESDWRLQSLEYGKPISPAQLQIPSSDRSHLTLATQKVILPGKILADRVILTAQIGDHKVNFQLDSGASQIVLDKSVADALKLPSYGNQTEATAGTYKASRSIVPRIDFGGATLENIAVETAPFHPWADAATPVAGLLGFDFMASTVVHIDYLHGEADALDPATFEPPVGAIALAIRLDDGVPVLAATIGATTSDHFILDTGADRSVLFSGFVAAHPNDAADQGLGEQFTEAYPFMDEVHGVGGIIKTTHTQVPSLAIGSAQFRRWLFSVVHDAPAFESEDYDGLIGQDVLRNFDVYLDYPSSKIFLVPNDRYRERWGT